MIGSHVARNESRIYSLTRKKETSGATPKFTRRPSCFPSTWSVIVISPTRMKKRP